MHIDVTRKHFTDESSIGELTLDGDFACYTLEPADRHLELNPELKIQNETAIPRGTYKLGLRHSPHLGATVPHLLEVPGFTYVYIHWGNKPKDTDGCILVGDHYAEDWVSDSRATYAKIAKRIEDALARDEEVTITVA